ncbi:hypothetical protein B0H21DRAFT_728406 [Amylocystis lapponica]|nr:hypothetical protein B0H21DRAFT_728406 [Amylocystis lapponica]
MNRKHQIQKVTIDMGFLEPSLLSNEVAIEDALSVLGSYLENFRSIRSVLIILPSSRRLTLELCQVSTTPHPCLEEWILGSFPLQAADYASAYSRAVMNAPAVCALLCSNVFHGTTKRKTQRERKQHKRRNTVIDLKPFEALGIDAPSSRAEADEVAGRILTEQKSILQHYLQILRRPGLKEMFQSSYIPTEEVVVDNANGRAEAEQTPSLETGTDTVPVAYPMVQPMKAALYFDSADGFGEWRVLISTRADADLRQARKREFKLFEIIVKKIKELSLGHFSDDNQKRLTGPETDIPIYEAKMTRDSRLIYQIDCVAEFETHVIIKIFGIYTHAQLDKRFWNGVGHQLARKGREYRDRCIFRRGPRVAGENVFLPQSWPAPAESDPSSWTSAIPDLHKDDLAKMHELLVLEKYVTFSQVGVLADKDVQHVFDISTHEMQIIEHPSSCYVIGRSGTGKTTTMMFKMLGIERSAQAYGDTLLKPRQLFVTQSRVLAEKVEQFFAKLLGALNTSNLSPRELEKMSVIGKVKEEQGLVDLDEEIARRGDLPKRFSELVDDHFPMFATFDQVCSLLEADFSTYNTEQLDSKPDFLSTKNLTDIAPLRSTDYMQQWRAAFVSHGVFLEHYWSHFPQRLTKGLDPTLVFGEFMGVIKGSEQTLEHGTGYLDKETYINFSYRQQATFLGKRETIYELFEIYSKRKRERGEYDASDRTHAILKRLRNGDLPGKQVDFIYIDEAQDNLLIDALILRTLCKNPASGLAFRFNDLKAFLYRIEASGQPQNASRVRQPESFQLAVNYRSHAGIVNCAHSIIELITKFWPNAIDTLAQEKGMIDGLKPVFFSGWDEDTVRYEQFLFGESGNQIEFGAEQCILVRDDNARERLRAQDSTVDLSQWRVVLNALSEDVGVKTPRFDEVRHSSVCRELKFLYVACTRARMNLWIADGSDKAEAMRLFWTRRDLVQNCTPGTDVPRLAVSSTLEQWAATARALFDRRRYTQAMHCYERASLPREKAVAYAYWLREQARSSPVNPSRSGTSQSKAFALAANAFWKSADEAVMEKLTYFRISAECYVSSGDDGNAAKAYYRAGEFDLAAQHYRKIGMFDEAVAVVKLHHEAMDSVITKNIVDVSKLFYLRDHKLKQARDLFESDKEALDYMDDYGFDMSRASYLEELGRPAEAAEVHLAEGRTLEAIELFSRDSQDPRSVFRASQCLLDGLWSHLSFGIKPSPDPESGSDSLRGLLRLLPALDVAKLDGRARDEVLMFRAIVSADFATLSQLGERFYRLHQDIAAALVCLDHVGSNLPNLRAASAHNVANTFQSFLLYARILQNLSADANPCSNEIMRRSFRFEPTTEEYFLIPKETWLYNFCSPSRRPTDRGEEVLRWDLEQLLRRLLRNRLRSQVRNENDLCHDIRVLQPCLPFIFSIATYCLRVRISVQQILIYHTVFAIEDYGNGHWIRQFYEVLYPAFYKLGSLHNLIPHMIPELQEGIHVLNVGVESSLSPSSQTRKILTPLAQNRVFEFRIRHPFCPPRHPTIRAVSAYKPEYLLRGNDKAYVVHDALSFMEDALSISLTRGVLFNRLRIDIAVFVTFGPSLWLTCCVKPQFPANEPTLHDVTLPRSWLMRLAQDFDRLPSRDSTEYDLTLYHLLFESKDLAYLGRKFSSVFIHRIITRYHISVGYNIRNDMLRRSVWRLSPLYANLIGVIIPVFRVSNLCLCECEDWDDLSRAVRRSTSGSSLDEMLQLHDAKKTPLAENLFNVHANSTAARSHPGAMLFPYSPCRCINSAPSMREDLHEEVEEAGEESYNISRTSRVFCHDREPRETISTEEELAALPSSRFVMSRARGMRMRLHAACYSAAQGVEWKPKSRYRKLFLGAVPHVLLCLERTREYLHTSKTQAKKRLKLVEHSEFEKVNAEIGAVSALFKQAIQLEKDLDPQSGIHTRRDVDELRRSVQKVEDLIYALPQGAASEWEEDLELAVFAIVEAKELAAAAAAAAKMPKPELNVEDDLLEWY